MKTSRSFPSIRTPTAIKSGAKKLKKKLGRIFGSKGGPKQGKRTENPENYYFTSAQFLADAMRSHEASKPLEIRTPQSSQAASTKNHEPEKPLYDFKTSSEYNRRREPIKIKKLPNTGPDQWPQAAESSNNWDLDPFGGQVVENIQRNDNTPKGNT